MSLEKIGIVHARRGKHDEAPGLFKQALAVYTRVLVIDNENNADQRPM